jgi:hypothetical protein
MHLDERWLAAQFNPALAPAANGVKTRRLEAEMNAMISLLILLWNAS